MVKPMNISRRIIRIRLSLLLAATALWIAGQSPFNERALSAQDFEQAPIHYATATPDNLVSRLQARLDAGEVTLKHDEHAGYLKAVLEELNVPAASQTLVFSKTSLQRQRISPRTPRAIYFNDEVYVGYCQAGDVVELSAADSRLGAVFYTLDQDVSHPPRIVRQVDNCLQCHGSSHTRHIPGHFIRSVYVDGSGFPALAMGTHRIDQSSPITKRWGGWYVTGTHGDQSHLGNLIVSARQDREPVDNAAGQNITSLESRFKTSAYLTPHSDIVALMVMEHQAEAQNLITRANFQATEALYAEQRLNKELGEPAGQRWDSTTTRIRNSSEELVKYLLFSGEATLTSRIEGTSSFAREFPDRGPRDSKGRSLRDFDLQRRLFKYPCSYLIYSEAFDHLPDESRERTLRRIFEVLTGVDRSPSFAHLTPDDRESILEILRDTKRNLPDYWHPEPLTVKSP